jgi:tetratricopeptide (TPR) repeat protein/DNA-binding winged helix-turn-helix (wHTH) protein
MSLYAFGPYVYDSARQNLTRDGLAVPVDVTAAEVLRRLLEARGGIVERTALLAQLWGDAHADDRALAAAVALLGETLGGAIVETVPLGYRLAVPVRLLPPAWWATERHVPPRWHRFAKPALAAIPALMLLGGVALYLDQRWDEEAHRLPPATLAIRPFEADPAGAESRLGIGLAEALIGHLGAQPRLAVRPMSTTRDPAGAAEYVLEGSIRRTAGRLDVSARLTHVASGAPRWSESFTEDESGPFRLQQALARRIAASLVPRFGAEDEAALAIPAPRRAEAWLLQVEARGYLARAEPELAPEAIELFGQAIRLDPGYAAAHAGLAAAHTLLAGAGAEDDRRLARASAERALALDDRNAEALAIKGDLDFFRAWDWSAAETAYRRAVAVSPHAVEAAEAYGWFLAAMGRRVEALTELGRALRLDPKRRRALERLGIVHWIAGQPELALAALDAAAAIEPRARPPHLARMLVLDQLGRFDEAMAARRAWLALGDRAELGDRLARMHESEGYPAAMAEWIRHLDRIDAPYEAALQWMAIGERERALGALERCVETRCASAPFLLQHPPLLPLHRVPRFQALTDRLGLRRG